MSRPLRILVAHNVPRARTGGMSRLMGLIHDQIVRSGHSVDYFCSEDLKPASKGRFERFTFPVQVLKYTRSATAEGRGYDIVNVHEPSGAALALFKKAAGSPHIVVTSHGVEQRAWDRALEDRVMGGGGPGIRTRILYPATVLWQTRIALRHADHVFCLNTEDRGYLSSRLGIPGCRVTRIFPGGDPIYGEAASQRDYARAHTLLFAGTWIKRKGVDDLCQAFCVLAARYPQLRLLVLNAGVPESSVTAAFPEGFRSRIVYRQAAPEAGNALAMSEADIYVLPSHFEGTPLTLIEAMWSAMPIISTETCGMKDVIESGVNGLLVPLRSPDALAAGIERLLQHPNMREKLGRSAHAEALQKYTWQRAAAPVLQKYEHLCQDSHTLSKCLTDA